MQVQITSHVRVCGETCEPGEIVDVPDTDAKTLLSCDKAVLVAPPKVDLKVEA